MHGAARGMSRDAVIARAPFVHVIHLLAEQRSWCTTTARELRVGGRLLFAIVVELAHDVGAVADLAGAELSDVASATSDKAAVLDAAVLDATRLKPTVCFYLPLHFKRILLTI